MVMRDVGYVVHAAAMKVVPKCEEDPFEAIRTNVEGAQHVIEAAINCGVKRVVAVSTDKCVSASTLYGATKACAERLFSAAHVYVGKRDTRFASVRYGNVAHSQGSVIPLWESILDRGETRVPITNPFCTRYWITLDEAVDLILWTIENMRGGEVVVPDMPAYQVSALAEAMGGVPDIIGMRKSEKLHEDIVSEHEFQDFRRCGPYWVKSEQIEGEQLISPMRSDSARRMGIDELRDRLGSLRVAA
jgi:UDP-N-acetylglucosamine 4,6-dehydratase